MNKIIEKLSKFVRPSITWAFVAALAVGGATLTFGQVVIPQLWTVSGTALVPASSTFDTIGNTSTDGIFNDLTVNGTASIGAFGTTTFNGTVTAQIFQADPEATQSITNASTTINVPATHIGLTSDADYVLTSVPSIEEGVDGQLVFLHNLGNFTIDIQDEADLPGSNLIVDGADNTIKAGGIMTIIYYEAGGTWHIVSNPNSSAAGANSDILAVRNSSGSAIAAGKAVYVSGFNVGQNRPTIALADADNSATIPAIGITATSISNNANGDVIILGNAIGLIDTSGASVGDGVWLDTTPGEVIFTRPTNDAVQRIGTVSRSNANGNIIVTGAGRTNDVPNDSTMSSLTLDTLGDATKGIVFGDGDSSIYESSDDLIQFALAGASRFLMNSNGFSSNSSGGASVRYSGTTIDSPGFAFSNDSDTGLGGTPSSNILSLITGGITALVIDASQDIGIGTTTPDTKFTVEGTIRSCINTLTDGASINIDWSTCNKQYVTLGGNRTITFSNVTEATSLTLHVIQDGTGSRTLTWPASVAWSGGTAPTLTTAAGSWDIITLTTATSTAQVAGGSVLDLQ